MLLLHIATILVIGRAARRISAMTPSGKLLRSALIAERVCPACLYALASDREEDGHLVCPECGAAWRIPQDD